VADQLVHKLDYDFGQLHIDTNLILNVALRAKKLDQVASRFLARHPDVVGLDLGAGLDTRLERLAPPATVDWYDIDFPTVAATRERVLPDRPQRACHRRRRDRGRLAGHGPHRPAVIVADGMMAFLTQDELVSLWNRLISHFPSGELVFNSYTRFAIWVAQHARATKSVADLVKFPGMDDPRAPEGWNPKLRLVREILLSREPEIAEFPPVPPAGSPQHRLVPDGNHRPALPLLKSLAVEDGRTTTVSVRSREEPVGQVRGESDAVDARLGGDELTEVLDHQIGQLDTFAPHRP
jgi:O-methyltransferase involved in polyketide biosynthesis